MSLHWTRIDELGRFGVYLGPASVEDFHLTDPLTGDELVELLDMANRVMDLEAENKELKAENERLEKEVEYGVYCDCDVSPKRCL